MQAARLDQVAHLLEEDMLDLRLTVADDPSAPPLAEEDFLFVEEQLRATATEAPYWWGLLSGVSAVRV